jgi:hypothetical protein
MIRWLGFGPPGRFDFEQARIERLAREKGGDE